LSFAGPREYRWQGLEMPVMMGKRRGAAQIATPSLEVCAASNRHKNLLFFATHSLAVYSRRNMIQTRDVSAHALESIADICTVGWLIN
jgi:hypothetical protein